MAATASAQKFVKRLKDALVAVGMQSTTTDYECLVVNGCKFEASAKGKVVTFLGSNFNVEPDGSFAEARAIGLVIAELPKRLERKAGVDRYTAAAEAVRAKLGERPSREGREYRCEYVHPSGAILAPSVRGLEVVFVVAGMAEAEELIRHQGHVSRCNWCPDPSNPSPEHHKDGHPRHDAVADGVMQEVKTTAAPGITDAEDPYLPG